MQPLVIYKGAFKGRTLQIVSKLRSRAFSFMRIKTIPIPKEDFLI